MLAPHIVQYILYSAISYLVYEIEGKLFAADIYLEKRTMTDSAYLYQNLTSIYKLVKLKVGSFICSSKSVIFGKVRFLSVLVVSIQAVSIQLFLD